MLLLIFVPFTVFSLGVIATEGFPALFGLALREKWGMQMLLDVGIFYVLFCAWLVPDARTRGISPWPYVAGTLVMGALSYLLHRELRAKDA